MLVTGASGFIGFHLLRTISEEVEVIGALIRSDDTSKFNGLRNIRFLHADLLDDYGLHSAVRNFDPDMVFHLAGVRPLGRTWDSIRQAYRTNVMGTINLLNSLQETRCQSIVLLGSTAEYGRGPSPFHESQALRPDSAYGVSKASASYLTLLAYQYFNLPVTVIRPTLIYGPGQGEHLFLSQLITTLLKGLPFAMTGGEQNRDFLYVGDLIEALCLAADHPGALGKIINVGSGVSLPLREVAEKVCQMTGRQELLQMGALPYSPEEQFDYCVDITLSRQLLGWKPHTTLEQGLVRTVQWYIQTA